LLDWLRQDPGGFLRFMAYRTPAVLLALTLHELAHGYAALKAGDTAARDAGRLSLNPLRHLDLIGTLSMFLMGVGWAKPVPVNPARFRNRRWDDLKVSLAGVTVNFLLFLLATAATVWLSRSLYTQEALQQLGIRFFLGFREEGFLLQLYPEYEKVIVIALKTPWLLHVQRFLFQLALVNVGMGLFNLLPIPPLDGFHVANDLLFEGRLNLGGRLFQITHIALMVLLIATDFIGDWIMKAINAVQGVVLPLMLSIFGR